ncbi:glycoside hydrolase family protein [Raoultella terrigena]|uniref:Glycoside hydrolase family protein n=1 Tax=Raoultella terrigena TaxID=577 RepID=A0A7Z8ZEG3_RAOTE|nr:glycoside hydrolase family protein [Raoultella terrigena]
MTTRPFPLLAAAAIVGVIPFHTVLAASAVTFADKVCDVTQYGAEGHRLQIALNTDAIQKAIDDCAAAGGGTVRVPKGNYLTNPLFLKSNIRLKLEKDATLVASSEVAAWRGDEKTQYAAAENGWLPFISIADAQKRRYRG